MKIKKTSTHGLTVILDAYNVIHAVPELERALDKSLEAARAALIRYCGRFREQKGNVARVVLVFDGARRKAYWDDPAVYSEGNCEIIFSDANQTADDRIIVLLEEIARPENAVVVSNDNYVANNARAHQVKVLSVAEFQRAAGSRAVPAVFQTLDSKTARDITEEYRHHLGIQ